MFRLWHFEQRYLEVDQRRVAASGGCQSFFGGDSAPLGRIMRSRGSCSGLRLVVQQCGHHFAGRGSCCRARQPVGFRHYFIEAVKSLSHKR